MTKIKKIAIIATHSFGYIDFIVDRLNSIDSVDLTYVNIDSIAFSYKNFYSRINNFFSKFFLLGNLKDKNRTNYINNIVKNKGSFDQILIIRPDKLEKDLLIYLRENAVEMTCYLFDGIENYPEQQNTLQFFDTIYSYDKNDVKKYNFQFLTNYIYDNEIKNITPRQTVFHISSYDKRFPMLQNLATNFELKNISYLFIVRKDSGHFNSKINLIKNYLSIQEVKNHIAESTILVDIQKNNQQGLSFRIFEALGYNKKIITNNEDIVRYDFYNVNNIWVITEDNLEIPQSFFETKYKPIDASVLRKYMLANWIETVFKVK
ncbi:hypothetical protein SAMN05444372_11379 [Flavobacterium micromati]|jgi:hypothetical protein|uniref:Uncharacterized protein n=1 Tax=Flavobacterium micromati TaxID=229205 RepID=A0A1M5PRR0_9FLAO|nr:hypothetical protein [Flavobacterium micromati]SHH04256.1 hypothetical protein SAMN05444372_11379 [Flavobacterium micromati]